MQLIVDANDKPEHIRLAASFLLHLVGDITDAETEAPAASSIPPPPPPPPSPPAAVETAAGSSGSSTSAAPSATAAVSPTSAPPPPPPSPPTAAATVNTAELSTSSQSAPTAGAAPGAASADEFDSAGLPWDGRIHQARKGVKKDGTWKVQKGADPKLVESVVKELLARKAPTPGTQTDAFPATTGSAPPPPPAPPVTVPAASSSVPVPPATVASDVSVIIPGAQASVPVPPAPAVGAVPNSGFRELIAKISAYTRAGKMDPTKVSTIVQRHGVANLQALRDRPDLIPAVETDIDVEGLS